MTKPHAEAVLSWRYPPPFEIYNLDASAPDRVVDSMLRPELRYFAVLNDEEEIIAFRCFGTDAQVPGGDYSSDALDMGGGLRPDLTGRGLGRVIIGAAMAFAFERFHPARFRATVAAFNVRARRVCERLGYRTESEFIRPSDGIKFIILSRETECPEPEKNEGQPNQSPQTTRAFGPRV